VEPANMDSSSGAVNFVQNGRTGWRVLEDSDPVKASAVSAFSAP